MTLGSRLFHLKFVVAFSSFVSKTKIQSEFRPMLMGGKSYKKRGKEILSGLTSGSSGNRWTRYGKTFVWDKFRSDRVWY